MTGKYVPQKPETIKSLFGPAILIWVALAGLAIILMTY